MVVEQFEIFISIKFPSFYPNPKGNKDALLPLGLDGSGGVKESEFNFKLYQYLNCFYRFFPGFITYIAADLLFKYILLGL